MSKSLHIAQVIDSLGEGGAERLLLTFAEVAISKHHKVSVISLTDHSRDTQPSFVTQRLLNLGANVIHIKSHKLYELRPFIKLFKIFQNEKFDVVQAHLSHGIILSGVVGWLTNTPVVATLHNPSPRKIGNYRAREWVWKFVLKHLVHRVIAVGRLIKEAYRSELPEEKVDLILNAVNEPPTLTEAGRTAIRSEVSGDSGLKLVMCVSRLIQGKGLFELLIAFAQAIKKVPDIFLVIIGDGELREKLVTEATSLGIFDKVRFLGFRNDVKQLLSSADMYVSASYSEGMSVALLEAMAAGLPIVATSVGEAPYLLSDRRGILIDPMNADILAEKIVYFFENPNEMAYMGNAVEEYVKENCSPNMWLEQLLLVYDKAMAKV